MNVAIVGSGPTGRAAARELANHGAAVTIFEKESEPGGLMRWGYPDYRMPVSITQRDVAGLRELGVEFRPNTELGKDVTLPDLEAQFDAVLITVGAPRPKRLGIPGEELPGVRAALDVLYAARAGEPLEFGPAVLVVGGGDTAVDAAVTARNQGSRNVTILTRDSAVAAPVQAHELQRSEAAGVTWRYGAHPVKIDAADDGLLVTLTGDGRTVGPERFDSVIVAIGQETDSAFLKALGLTVNDDGSTNHPNVWLAGGSRYGSDRLAKAIQDGRAMAERILKA